MKQKINKRISKDKSFGQVVSVGKVLARRKGVAEKFRLNGVYKDTNSRNFETRKEPRYVIAPEVPEGLPGAESFSESAQRVLKERYLLKDTNFELKETIEERFWHVAYDLASAEFDFGASTEEVYAKAVEFYRMMVMQQFLPNSPTLMNAGKHNGLQYSACFVLPVEDSLGGIFDTIKAAALIHQTGGGTGFAFSRLRPNGSMVNTTGGVASGPVSFLRVFNAATESIKQGGTRRGANMGILRADHPDIMEFIRCKAILDDHHEPIYEAIAPMLPNDEAREYFKQMMLDRQISNFNISVAVTDRFMEAYFKGDDYDLIDPRTKEVTGSLNAKEVFDEIIDRAWHTGDPGLVFIDRINHSTSNPVPELEEIESTNPCGEQPLAPWDACNLGSINLGKFILGDGSDMDWEGLRAVVRNSVNFLDNVVQVNPYTLEQIYSEAHRNRRIGLGVMGWADALFLLKIAYGSDEALDLGERVMKFINEEGHRMSEELAVKRGPFPNWGHSIYADKGVLRNATVTTIAPTGTISIIADCSSGIEPVFALAYLHKAKTRGNEVRTLVIANKTFESVAKENGFYSEGLTEEVMNRGTVTGLEAVPEDWQRVFVTAQEIEPVWHVKMQAAFQKYTDNGVSKTINLPNSATKEDVANAYLMAWDTGCNGITIYRDGSKVQQVLNISSSLNKTRAGSETVEEEISNALTEPRPMVLRGRTYHVATPVGDAFVTVNRDESDMPFEVFVTLGKGGMHTTADAEAMGRLVSLILRASRKDQRKEIARKIASQLRGIGGASHIGFGKARVMSLADAVAKVLSEDLEIENGVSDGESVPLQLAMGENKVEKMPEESENRADPKLKQADLCPECGVASFVREDGCEKCYSCGYSKC